MVERKFTVAKPIAASMRHTYTDRVKLLYSRRWLCEMHVRDFHIHHKKRPIFAVQTAKKLINMSNLKNDFIGGYISFFANFLFISIFNPILCSLWKFGVHSIIISRVIGCVTIWHSRSWWSIITVGPDRDFRWLYFVELHVNTWKNSPNSD